MTAQRLTDFKETSAGLEITILNDKPCPDCGNLGTDHTLFCEYPKESEAQQRERACEERLEIMDLVKEAEEKEWHADTLLAEVVEYQICNGWELIPERDYLSLGCLTSAPMISQEITRDDSGEEILEAGKIYWYEPYQVLDPVEQLLKYGKVVFNKGWSEEEKQ